MLVGYAKNANPPYTVLPGSLVNDFTFTLWKTISDPGFTNPCGSGASPRSGFSR